MTDEERALSRKERERRRRNSSTVYPTQADREQELWVQQQTAPRKNWRHYSAEWTRFSDSTTGFDYWYHARTGETLWCDD